MTARAWVILVVVIAAVAFGGMRLLSPRAEKAAGESADALVGTVSSAYFTAAQASLEAQRHATGSYVGTAITPPLALVRADASTYCVQLTQPTQVTHLDGPGGSPVPGPCN